MKKRSKTLILALCAALLLSSAVCAASRTKEITAYYNNIKLVVDGVPVTPKDANGATVEPFIVDGTTYLPVRAIGESLGKTVKWDGNTQTVYIGGVPGEDTYLLDVCPPYEKSYHYDATDYFSMMGQTYYHGFKLQADDNAAYAYFNLNGQYESLEVDFGHIDGTSMSNASYEIYLDGKFQQVIEGAPDMVVQHLTIPLNYALQMKIVCSAGNSFAYYGFANAVLR